MQNPKKPSRWQQFLNGGGDFFMILFGGIGVCVLFAILTSQINFDQFQKSAGL
jgi:hypothetical protein